ncbi:ABC transporter permease [Parazoarcus communis]|uniref:ABC transporter permease n=1 Tax=Parazoarcus communis TaxID=41977 RepID=A0A2U8GYF2_9RHOO|nr:ABC transporter permease subunit [Parazoarcus communis]AWI78747.1 ABC transporter permease [Parazoarcus communis]
MSAAAQIPLMPADRWLLRVSLWIPLGALLLFFALPMLYIGARSFMIDGGGVGLGNYLALLDTPGVWRATLNSLWLGLATTVVTLVLAFFLAYGLERTCMAGKRFVGLCLSLPMLAPSLVLGLGLIFILGRNGIVGKVLDIRPEMYGFWGLLIADVLYALPQAVMILRVALSQADARQYEAAEVLGASPWRQFMDLTLPGMRYGLLSAGLVVFTITITDFGNAVVIGGDFSVLATEIYNQVSGQMRFGMGAVVGLLLLLPAALSVWIERVAARRQAGIGAESASPPQPVRAPARDAAYTVIGIGIAASIFFVVATVVVAGFIRLWPYRLDFTLKHYDITVSGGYDSLWTSLAVSLLAAAAGTALLFLLSFSVRRLGGWSARLVTLLAALPVGVPGLVLGLGYVFAFNAPDMPWTVFYGTVWLLAMCNFYHYHTQGYVTMMTGLRNVPSALEDAVGVLGGGTMRLLRDVYLPAARNTLWTVAAFLFMRSMVTLSAVIFLITPTLSLSAVTVMRLDEAGFTSQAAAFSSLIMLVVGTVSLGLHLANRRAGGH